MRLRHAICSYSSLLSVGLLAIFLAGCGTMDSDNNQVPPSGPAAASSTPVSPSPAQAPVVSLRTDPFRVGDRVKVDFSGSPTPIPFVETEIKGDGTIRLDFVGDIRAAGQTPGELERDIQSKYVPNYYTHLNVTVTPVVRYFYVDGEINGGGSSGGRVMYVGPITVTRAIAAAGGFNPFAARTKVKLFRVDGKKAIVINCVKALDHPELDVPVYPGDKIFVPRRYF